MTHDTLGSGTLLTSRAAMKWLTLLALAGVTIGVVGGILVARFEPPGAGAAVAMAGALVRAWTNAFRLIVAPLVMAQLFIAVAGEREARGSGRRTGLAIPVVFFGLLGFCAVVAFATTPLLLQLPWVSDVSLVAANGAESAEVASATGGASSRWVDGYIPPNIFAAATTDNILPLMLFALVFGLAVRRIDKSARRRCMAWRSVYRRRCSPSLDGCWCLRRL